MPLARNPKTGEVLYLTDQGQWEPSKRATNPQTGEELVFDGKGWTPPPLDMQREIAAVSGGPNKAIARTFGAPVDLMTGALNLGARGVNAAFGTDIPPIEKPFGGSESIESGLKAVGVPDPNMRPQTTTGRVLKRVGEEVTAAGLTLGTARGLTAAADAGRVALGPTARNVAGVFGSSPGTQAVASAGAGAGAAAANEIMPGSYGAEVTGLLAGGLAGAAVSPVVRYLYEGGKAFLEPLTRSGQEAIVGRSLKTLATYSDDLARGGKAGRVAGSKPTTAQAYNDPGLAATERALRNNPETAAAFSQRDAANNLARTERFSRAIPEGSAAATQRSVQTQVDDYARAMGEAVDTARQNVERRIQHLGPGMTETQAGRIVREEYDDAVQGMRRAVRQAYRAIDPQGTSSIPPEGIWDDVAAIASEYFGNATKGVPDELSDIITRFRGGPLTFNAIDDMAKEASNIAGKAARAGDNRLASAAGQIADAIRGGLDDAAAAGAGFTDDQIRAYQAARALRRQLGVQFEQGNVGKVGATRAFGEPVLTESEIPAQFFHSSKGAPDDAAQFVASFGDRPRATAALRDYVVGDLQRSVVDETGAVNPQRLRSWLDRHRSVLRQFPEIGQQVQSLRAAQNTLDDMVGRQTRGLRDVQRGALGLFLDGADPDVAVRRLMADSTTPAEMRRFVSTIRQDPQAMAGLRRSILERGVPELRGDFYADQLGDVNRIPWPKVKNFINNNRDKLGIIYTPKQLKVMEKIAEDLQMANISQAGGRVAGSNTIQNLSTANLIARLTAGGVNLTEGGPGLVGNVMTSMGRFVSWAYRAPEQQVQQLLVDAMLDPKLAQRLVQKPTPANLRQLTTMLRNRGLVTLGVAGTDLTAGSAAIENRQAAPAQ